MTSPEIRAAKDYLLKEGEPKLATLIKDSESDFPIWESADTDGNRRSMTFDDTNKLHAAFVVGHQVHDKNAHLDQEGSVCCPFHGGIRSCEIHDWTYLR